MTLVYDFLIHRTARLLGDLSQQTQHQYYEMVDCQTCLTEIVTRFEKNIQNLKKINQDLGGMKRTCERVQEVSNECVQAIESCDLNELIEYRKQYLKENRGKAYTTRPLLVSRV